MPLTRRNTRLALARDNRDMPGEGVEPPGNRSAVGHISRSVTPAPVCASEETVLKLWSTMSAAQGGLFEEFRRLIGPGPAIPEGDSRSLPHPSLNFVSKRIKHDPP